MSLPHGDKMNRYTKGARGERELLSKFYSLGYQVIRSAGSGVNAVSPDIIAVKGDIGFCFECKAWDKGSLSIDWEKFDELKKWENNTRLKTYIAWRMNGVGWYFIRLDEMNKNARSYSVTKKQALMINRQFEKLEI